MTREDFSGKVVEKLKELVLDGVDVRVHAVPKNNGIVLDAVTIMTPGQEIAPTIYLEPYYREYCGGTPVTEIASEILAANGEFSVCDLITPGIPAGYEDVKERIRYRLINYGMNREMLGGMPHSRFLDLAKVYYYTMDVGSDCTATAAVSGSDLRRWQVSEEDLERQADKNMRAAEPARMESMQETLNALLRTSPEAQVPLIQEDPVQMYVLTNSSRRYGAACMLYENIFTFISRDLSQDFFILPSSIHEVILLPDTGEFSADTLREMVTEINREHVMPFEVLSDNVYHYSGRDRSLEVAGARYR